MRTNNKRRGFTLIELLIVVAIIAILAAIVFVALNPLVRFRDSRDSVRWQTVASLLEAIKLDQVDNGGAYLAAIQAMTTGTVYMIGTDVTGCNSYNTYCDTVVGGVGTCVNLTGLVTEGYLGSVPISPNGAGSWTVGHTGYTLTRASTGIITIRACESENSNEITLSR